MDISQGISQSARLQYKYRLLQLRTSSDQQELPGQFFSSQRKTFHVAFRDCAAKNGFSMDNDRILLHGFETVIENRLKLRVTRLEIDETIRALENADQSRSDGLWINAGFWRQVLRDFGGLLPVKLTYKGENEFVRPHEPFMMIELTGQDAVGFVGWLKGQLNIAAAASQQVTSDLNWKQYLNRIFHDSDERVVKNFEPLVSSSAVNDAYESAFEDSSFAGYDFFEEARKHLLPQAMRYAQEGNDTVVQAQPGRKDAVRAVLYLAKLAIQNGLYEERGGFKYPRNIRCQIPASLPEKEIAQLVDDLLARKLAPSAWVSYSLAEKQQSKRTCLSRDDLIYFIDPQPKWFTHTSTPALKQRKEIDGLPFKEKQTACELR